MDGKTSARDLRGFFLTRKTTARPCQNSKTSGADQPEVRRDGVNVALAANGFFAKFSWA